MTHIHIDQTTCVFPPAYQLQSVIRLHTEQTE